MAKVVAYEVKVNGLDRAIKNQDELTQALKETTAEYKKADFGTDKYKAAEKEVVNLSNLQKKLRADTRDAAKEAELSADKAKRSYRGLSAELNALRNKYRELSEEERGIAGPGLLKRIQALDKELKDIDASMGQFQRNVGNYSSALSGIGGLDIASFATIPGAVAAVGTAAIAAGKYLVTMSAEVGKLRGELETLTGANGADLDEFTARVLAISETFKVTTDEVTIAANAVANQLGIPFDQALVKIEEGFVAGSNAQGDFLDQLKEYPAFFREAGLSADQLFKVINQSAKAGIYSDKGVDTIKEANLRLRENTTATQAALAGIGLESEEVAKLIEEKGIGAAIAKVSERLGELRADSPAVGTAIADIFGGPGEDAGLAFLLTLKDLNDQTGSLIDTTNQYQAAQLKTLEINQEFARAQNDLAKEIGGAGGELANLGTQIKTALIDFAILAIQNIKVLWASTQPLRDAFGRLGQALGLFNENGEKTERLMGILNVVIKSQRFVWELLGKALGFVVDRVASFANGITSLLVKIGLLDKDARAAADATRQQAKAQSDAAAEGKKQEQQTEKTSKQLKDYTKATKEAAIATDTFAKGSVAALNKEIAALKKELDEGDPAKAGPIIQRLVQAEKELEKIEALREKLRREATGGAAQGAVPTIGTLGTPDAVVSTKAAQQREKEGADKIVQINKKRNEDLVQQEKNRAAAISEIQDTIFQSINSVLNTLTDASNARRDSEIESLEERYGREIELAEGNAAKQEELQKELDTQKAAIEKREFERQKKYRRASALASYAEGVINILAAPTTIPDPFGTLFKAVRIGVLTFTLGQQLSAIDQQQAAKGIIIDGVARGAAHSDAGGGIPISANGQSVMIENGEATQFDEFGALAIINKRSTAENYGVLNSIKDISFAGKRELLSEINSQKGYGIPFARTGALLQPDAVSVADVAANPGGSSSSVALSGASIKAIANQIAIATMEGAKAGVKDGLNQATQRAEREAKLSTRTGV